MRFQIPTTGIWSTCVLFLLTTAPAARAATINVPAGGNLQTALNAAKPGDVITLQPGVTYTGNFMLPNKGAISDYITVRSAAADNQFPPPGVRMTPAYASLLPRLKSANSVSVLRTAAAANHWKLMFLEFQANANGYGDIIALGAGDSTQTQLSQVPYELVLDRVYVHGDPLLGQKRGISLQSRDTAIVNSYISDCKAVGQDSQAINGWNGPGNYLIENNYLEGATENFLLGGADPAIPNLVTGNITFRRNYLYKPLAWRDAIVAAPAGVSAIAAPGAGSLAAGTYFYTVVARRAAGQTNKAVSSPSVEVAAALPAGGGVTISWPPVVGADDYLVYGRTAGGENIYWRTTSAYFADSGAAGTSGTPAKATKWAVKNIFELKNAQDILVEGNVFENLWVADQPGFPIVFTPRNQSGNAPWVAVQRVTFRNNIVRHTAGGVNIMGSDNLAPSQLTNHVAVYGNLFDDLTGSSWGTGSRPFQIGGGDAVTIDHNTVITTDTAIVWLYGGTATSPTPITNARITNNMAPHNTYGIDGSNYQPGNSSIAAYLPGAVVTGNVLAGGSASKYPAGNFFPTVAAWQNGFANFAAGDYHLRASSPYKGAAIDGSDLGANVDEILAETANALSGDNSVAPNTARVRIVTTALPNGTLNQPYAQMLACTGGSGACGWIVDENLLPAGISFDAVAGVIVGVPAKIETGSIKIEAYDVNYPTNSTSGSLDLTIDPPPFVVTLPAAASSRVGSELQIAPAVSGALGTVSWTVASGDLPAGVALEAVSGRIAGVPSAWGTTTALVEARDSWRADRADSKPLTITVEPTPVSVATAALSHGEYQAMYRADLQANGGTGATRWSLAGGALPSGLTLDSNGILSGVPQSIGVATITVQAADANWPGNAASATLSITIDPPALSMMMPPGPAARAGQTYEITPSVRGNVGTVSWSLASGSLPDGLALDPARGSIAGTPTGWGTATLVIRATDDWAAGRIIEQPLTIEVAPVALAISTGTLAAGTYQTAYADVLRASGGTGTVRWSIVSGALPNGLTLDSVSGAITGTPIEIGTFAFAVMAADSNWAGETAAQTVSVAVAPPPFSAAVPASTTGQVGTPYLARAVATGQVGVAVWSLASGSLPPGVSLDAATGVIAGVPSAFGIFTAIVEAQDSWSAARVAGATMTVMVAPSPFVIAGGTLPPAAYRSSYQATLAASGGTGLTTWTLEGGALPPGLTLSPAGAISGAPTAVGTFAFTARAVDGAWAGNAAAQEFSITVGAREIVLYATDATTIAGAWALVQDSTAAGGVRMANPDKGAAKLNTPLAAPANYFDIPFAAEAGVAYHLWIRGKAQSNSWSNDSVMVQFSNSVDAAGAAKYRIGTTSGQDVNLEDCSGCGVSGWGWQDNGWGVNVMGPAIYFDRPGPATIRVQVKEDGFSMDQVVLSAGNYLNMSPGALKNDTTILLR